MRDSPTNRWEVMAEPADKGRKRLDLLAVAAAGFFLLAVAFAAAPALNAGPATLAGLLLLVGLAGVAFLGLLAFRASARPVESDDASEALIEALSEPAAIAGADGRIAAANGAWSEAVGPSRRLPRGGELFSALQKARHGEITKTRVSERPASVAPLGHGRFLVRLVEAAAPSRAAADERRADAAAPQSLDAFAAAAPFGAALLDGDEVFTAVIVEVNPALAAITGGKADVGAPFGNLIAPGSHIEAGLGVSEGASGPFEVRLAHDPTRIAHLYLARSGGRLVAYLVDVSEQKQIELQLSQSQKMQAIGQLAGGVAHDFNNLLTAIQLRLDELLQRHPVGDPSYEGLNEIRQTAVRAADLVRKLLAFSRKQTVQREVLDLGELISEFEVLLRRLLREDVKLVTDYGRNLPQVRADKSQLETAVMNLAVNARDAVRSSGHGGTVTIRTARLSYAEAQGLGYAGPPAADLALIEVTDDGPGIAPEVQGKIFDPFFTTKPVGEGTGLGLATVYGIVRQSDGWIHLDSKVGEGSAFRIFLPVHIPSPAAAVFPAPTPQPAKRAPRDLSGVGRILFVEDEDAVRGVAARLLRARGYEVIEACDGEEALILAEENAGQIDLLISDVIMPGIDGPTLLKKARQYLGSAPVMFISGYAEAEFSDLLEGETGVTFLPKPLDIKVLAERVKQQLQAA
ncbi:MAG TPA: ATP-binding protein [Caulobacteraceae bacterium]|nr:ATP-binding protein [Caulobacteraceae bacterium]